MLTDFAALTLAWLAFRLARRPTDWQRSYGFDRFSVLAAFINGLSLFMIAAWIVWEAIERLAEPGPVLGGPMLAVALVGLLVNLAVLGIMRRADAENLNVRAATLHVIGDLLGSLAAIAAAGVILATGWTPIDPLLSLLVAAIILRSAWGVTRSAGHILLEGAPAGLAPDRVARDLVEHVGGVAEVHHVHIWSITEEQAVATMHARLAGGADPAAALRQIKHRLGEAFHIGHATVEIEPAEADCADAACSDANRADAARP